VLAVQTDGGRLVFIGSGRYPAIREPHDQSDADI
jgi:hypothetical protein